MSVKTRPVFIIGPPRTGTTLLSRMLASGDSVLSLSEPLHLHTLLPHPLLLLFFFFFRRRHPRLRHVGYPRRCSTDDFLEYLESIAERNGFRNLAIKEVFHETDLKPPFSNLPLLDNLVARGHPIIGITRHPCDAAASTIKLFNMLLKGVNGLAVRLLWPTAPRPESDTEIVEWAAKNWVDFSRWIERHDLPLTRYEDLVRTPAEELPRICEAIGLPFIPRMLAHHKHRSATWGGVGDPAQVLAGAKAVHVNSIGKGRSLSAEHRAMIREICGRRADELGYTFDAPVETHDASVSRAGVATC